MFERFTDRARKVMALADQEAQRFNHEYIGTEHILLGLIKEGSEIGATVLKNLGMSLLKIRLEVEKRVKPGPNKEFEETVTMGKLSQTPCAKKAIEYAIEEARSLSHNYVGTEHILLGLIREQAVDTVAIQILLGFGLTLERIREEALNLLGLADEKKKKQNIKKVAIKKKQRPVKCEFFEKQEFVIQETEAQEIRKTTPRGSMSDDEVKEAIAKFLSDKEFVQATEYPVEPFRNLKTPLIITKITIWYKDKDSS